PSGSVSAAACPPLLPPVSLYLRDTTLTDLARCTPAEPVASSDAERASLLPEGLRRSPGVDDLVRACRYGAPQDVYPWPDPTAASVLVVRGLAYTPPRVVEERIGDHGPEATFVPGSARGEVIVIDRRTLTVACAATWDATNLEEIETPL